MKNTTIRMRAWDGSKMILPEFPFINDVPGSASSSRYVAVTLDGKAITPNAYGLHDVEALSAKENIITMLSSGVFDKNDKEIFDRDIIKVNSNKIMEVVFDKGCFYTIYNTSHYRLGGWVKSAIKVIGNTIENPDIKFGDVPFRYLNNKEWKASVIQYLTKANVPIHTNKDPIPAADAIKHVQDETKIGEGIAKRIIEDAVAHMNKAQWL